ncbi:MAG: substrate-binding domain-containing protein [Pirellulales bacterium]
MHTVWETMRKRLRIAVSVVALVATVSGLAGCQGSDDASAGSGDADGELKRIILLTNGNSPFWDACRHGLQQAEKDLKLQEAGLRAVMEVNDGTPAGQINKLRQFNTQSDIAAVAVSALDADNEAVAQEMRNLQEKGVHVICVDNDVNRERLRDARSFYIGTDNVEGGHALATATRVLLKAKGVESGGYVQFVGTTGAFNARARMDGFQEAIGKEYVERDRMGTWDASTSRENVRNAIRNHADLVALVGIYSFNAPAIVDVVTQDNVRDDYVVACFDAEPIAVSQMGKGHIDVLVVQNPYDMGYQCVRALKALHEDSQETLDEMFPNREEEGGDIYDTGLKLVVPDESSPLNAEMFDEKTQFLTLPEFQAWLDKFGLKGS